MLFISDSKEVTNARKRLLIQNFKCYHEDEFIGTSWDALESEEPIYACKFGEGHDFGHILAVADEVGVIGLRDTRPGGNTVPFKGIYFMSKWLVVNYQE